MKLPCLILLTLLTPIAAVFPGELRGRVVSVEDGDSFVLERAGVKIAAALYGIEAPEKGQPFADEARAYLSKLIQGKDVRLVEAGRRGDGRILVRVFVGALAVQTELLTRGLVWVVPGQSSTEYQTLERTARARRPGLWSQARPVAPWDYRANRPGTRAAPDCDDPPAPVAPPPPETGPPAGTGGCSFE